VVCRYRFSIGEVDHAEPTFSACTAVVTEIAHHAKPTIDADVSFLSEAEWKEELAVLLQDLVDEDGNLKRSTDLKSDAGVAWQKVFRLRTSLRALFNNNNIDQVHAVYPSVSQEQLVKMTADHIIARDASKFRFARNCHQVYLLIRFV
jgi:hypothetical protein